MTAVTTLGDEEVRVSDCGDDSLVVEITDPAFGRIARVRIDHTQAARLANALDERLVTAALRQSTAPE
jgi:hypothetical protein